MNKEQIIDDAYKNYLIEDTKVLPNMPKEKMTELGFRLTQEEFINKCKTDTEFSERWGLKIYTKVDGDKVWMGMVYNDNAVEIRLK